MHGSPNPVLASAGVLPLQIAEVNIGRWSTAPLGDIDALPPEHSTEFNPEYVLEIYKLLENNELTGAARKVQICLTNA